MQVRYEVKQLETAKEIQAALLKRGGFSQVLMIGRKYPDGAILECPEHWGPWVESHYQVE